MEDVINMKIFSLQPSFFLSGVNFSGTNLKNADLKQADSSGANVEKARFGGNSGLSEAMKRQLQKRGGCLN